MDWLLDVFATWLYGLKVIAITLAVIMFISGLDDFFIDVVYWGRRIKRKLSVYAKWHLNRSQFGIRIDHDLASISDHSLASQSITIWHASDH